MLFVVDGVILATDLGGAGVLLFFNSNQRVFSSFALAVGSLSFLCLQSA